MPKATTKKRPLVGSRVRMDYGGRRRVARIIEDRGLIGIGGRRLIRIRLPMKYGVEPVEFEVPLEEVRLIDK